MQDPLLICQHPPDRQQHLFRARDYVSGETFEVLRCAACGLALTHPAPIGAEMEKYYPPVYYAQSGSKRFPAAVELVQQFLYGRRAGKVEHLNGGRPGRVLDVGCGPGFLLRQFQKRGWEAEGTEFSAQSAAHARQLLGVPIHAGDLASANFPKAHFDAVILWHVLEHVPSPAATIREVERILRPGGIFLVGVPNFGSWEARLGRDKWFHLDVPRHLNHFVVPTVKRLLEDAGLRVQSQSFLAPEYDCFSFVQTALNRVGLRHNLLYRLLRQGRADVLRKENFGQILLTLLLAVPLGLLSLPATLLAALLSQGTAVSLYARKPRN